MIFVQSASAGIVGSAFIIHIARVGRSHLFDDFSVLVVTSDVDGGILQFLLDGGTGSENDLAGGDESRTYIFHFGDSRGLQAEAHGTHSGQGNGMSLGGPCLDNLTNGFPGSLKVPFGIPERMEASDMTFSCFSVL